MRFVEDFGPSDADGNVYVSGFTNSTDFPATVDLREYQTDPGNEAYDAFVLKLSPGGSVIYSTLFGGTFTDAAMAISVDAAGRRLVCVRFPA